MNILLLENEILWRFSTLALRKQFQGKLLTFCCLQDFTDQLSRSSYDVKSKQMFWIDNGLYYEFKKLNSHKESFKSIDQIDGSSVYYTKHRCLFRY